MIKYVQSKHKECTILESDSDSDDEDGRREISHDSTMGMELDHNNNEENGIETAKKQRNE